MREKQKRNIWLDEKSSDGGIQMIKVWIEIK